MQQAERRFYGTKSFRTINRDNEKIIEGHAAVFNQWANIGGRFDEIIDYGAFDGCDLSNVVLLVNHNEQRIPLARNKSGTMSLTVDNVGLAFRARLDVDNNPDARALFSAIERGDICGMSFAFTIDLDDWQNLDSDMPTRRIKKIGKVFEISGVTNPAYEGTDVTAERAKSTLDAARQNSANAVDLKRLKKEIMEKYGMENKNQSTTTQDALALAGEEFRQVNRHTEIQSPYNIFGERRAMTVTSTPPSIVIPTHTGATISATFPAVSSLIESVTHLSLQSGESFKQPYATGFFDTAYYTDEAAEAALMDIQFGYAELNRCKITAYAELSEELQKLPAAPYAETVFQAVGIAIRKAVTKEILFGEGINSEGTRHRLTGIFSDKATAIDADTDLAISQITDTLLDDILLKYGGDTDVAQPATLIINKQDLLALSKVRSSVKSRINEITFDTGNTGRINGIPFIIDSNLPAITDPATKSGDYVMCYGNPRNYTLVEFSPLTIEKSVHYKFPRGIVCFRGTAFVGGNVTKQNGFLRIVKKI